MNLDYLLPFLNFFHLCFHLLRHLRCCPRQDSILPSLQSTYFSLHSSDSADRNESRRLLLVKRSSCYEGKEDEMGNEKAGAKAEGMEAF